MTRIDGTDGAVPQVPSAAGRRLVALDVDGTLMTYDGVISPDVKTAVSDLRQVHEVVISTGRSLVGTLPVLAELEITEGWAVCSNGSVTVRMDPALPDGYELVDVVTFDPEPALRMVRAELPDALYAVEDLGRGFRVSGEFPVGELQGEHRLVDFEDLCAAPATRVVVRSTDHSNDDFHDVVNRLGLHEVSYAIGWSAWLDLAPSGVSKASALDLLRQRLELPRETTVAVGDGRNDIEMLQWAAHGVAMGHADADTQAAADHITGSIDEDGAVPVLHALLG